MKELQLFRDAVKQRLMDGSAEFKIENDENSNEFLIFSVKLDDLYVRMYAWRSGNVSFSTSYYTNVFEGMLDVYEQKELSRRCFLQYLQSQIEEREAEISDLKADLNELYTMN